MNALAEAAKEGFRQDQREGMASVMFADIANSSGIAGAAQPAKSAFPGPRRSWWGIPLDSRFKMPRQSLSKGWKART